MNEKQPAFLQAGDKFESYVCFAVPLRPGHTRILFQPRRTSVNTVYSRMDTERLTLTQGRL